MIKNIAKGRETPKGGSQAGTGDRAPESVSRLYRRSQIKSHLTQFKARA